jgi:hypothetical protein
MRNQKQGLTGKAIFSTTVKAEVTEEEKQNIEKYRLGKTILFTNMEDRGTGLLGAISRKMMATDLTVNDLVKGKTIEYKDILEMIYFEKQIVEASEFFKEIVETMASFGGETIIDI